MKKIFLLLFTFICLFSCTNENLIKDTNSINGLSVKFTTDEFSEIHTRADGNVDNVLNKVTVLEFKEGKLIKTKELLDVIQNKLISLTDIDPIPATNVSTDVNTGRKTILNPEHANVLVFIANSDVSALKVNVSTFEEFTALTQEFDQSSESLPMVGYYYDGIVDGIQNILNVSLVRTIAKISFTLNTDNFKINNTKASVIIKDITICNVPTKTTLFACENRPSIPSDGKPGLWSGVMKPFPSYNAEDFKSLPLTYVNNNTEEVVSVYMPENARGSFFNIVNNKDKCPKKGELQNGLIPEEYSDGLTYIKVRLTYLTNSGFSGDATYNIYLGGDERGDMNILRNTTYYVKTFLYGINKADTRIEIKNQWNPNIVNFQDGQTPQSAANCYIIDPWSFDFATKSYNISLNMARQGWKLIDSYTNANGSTLEMFDDLIKNRDWKIVTLWRTWGENDPEKNISGEKLTGVTGGDNGESNYYANLDFSKLKDYANNWNLGQNAVIALVNKEEYTYNGKKIAAGTKFWSWHLWFTDYNPNELNQGYDDGYTIKAFQKGGIYYQRKMMSVNLGAPIRKSKITTAITSLDIASEHYGMLYQWGRKDPLTYPSKNNDNTFSELKIYNAKGESTDITKSQIATASDESLLNSIQNPTTVYCNVNNWSGIDAKLWNNKEGKTPFDPSPYGWEVPCSDTWNGFSWWTFSKKTYGSGIDKVYYVAEGNRSVEDGKISHANSYGFYWSGADSNSDAYILKFKMAGANNSLEFSKVEKSTSCPIRCVQSE